MGARGQVLLVFQCVATLAAAQEFPPDQQECAPAMAEESRETFFRFLEALDELAVSSWTELVVRYESEPCFIEVDDLGGPPAQTRLLVRCEPKPNWVLKELERALEKWQVWEDNPDLAMELRILTRVGRIPTVSWRSRNEITYERETWNGWGIRLARFRCEEWRSTFHTADTDHSNGVLLTAVVNR